MNTSMLRLTLVATWLGCFLVNAHWIDPDTSIKDQTTYAKAKSYVNAAHRPFQLVFSDEFEQDGRTFKDGQDPRWTAINRDDGKRILVSWLYFISGGCQCDPFHIIFLLFT